LPLLQPMADRNQVCQATLPARPEPFEAGFVIVEKPAMDAITRAEWRVIEAQRSRYMAGRQAREILALLRAAQEDASFGYAVSMYDHGLQAATLALQAGEDEEFVVVALLHDIGFTIAGPSHGAFSAALLRPYISERNRWVLEMHQLFGYPHMLEHPDVTVDERERFRGHPHFAATADFVARYDQGAIDSSVPTLPLAAFEPMVHRLFAKPPTARSEST
jgi:predicted HD phosphohydrolase